MAVRQTADCMCVSMATAGRVPVLNLETTNGGADLEIPADYSARLETATVNGGWDIDYPLVVQGRIARRLTSDLGDGGPPIRAVTTNGGVSIDRR